MKKLIIVLLAVCFLSGCAYNSANLMAFIGRDMDFSYGLISIKNVDRVILLRETNAGEGNVEYNIPDVSLCIPYAPIDDIKDELLPTEEISLPDIDLPEIAPKSKSIYPRDK